jgi:hypothetical protein
MPGSIENMIVALTALEEDVATAARASNPEDQVRVYDIMPDAKPQLPAIWNWIDDGDYRIDDTGPRATDVIVVEASVAVRVGPKASQTMRQALRLTDIFRDVVDPALETRQPLGGTANRAGRLLTRPQYVDFGGTSVFTMQMLIRVELSRNLNQ